MINIHQYSPIFNNDQYSTTINTHQYSTTINIHQYSTMINRMKSYSYWTWHIYSWSTWNWPIKNGDVPVRKLLRRQLCRATTAEDVTTQFLVGSWWSNVHEFQAGLSYETSWKYGIYIYIYMYLISTYKTIHIYIIYYHYTICVYIYIYKCDYIYIIIKCLDINNLGFLPEVSLPNSGISLIWTCWEKSNLMPSFAHHLMGIWRYPLVI